jgi:hypothetical protein
VTMVSVIDRMTPARWIAGVYATLGWESSHRQGGWPGVFTVGIQPAPCASLLALAFCSAQAYNGPTPIAGPVE